MYGNVHILFCPLLATPMGVVGVTMLIYIYIYIYLRSMRSAGKCANTKMKYPFNCMWCMHAGW